MPRRLVFIFSTDHGEQVNADLFCRHQDFEVCRLYPEQGSLPAAPGPADARYRSVEQLLAAVERFHPDLVVLASAYLLTVNNVFDPVEVERLVAGLRQRGCVLATTDPWMGYWRRYPDARFQLRGLGEHPQRRQIEARLRRLQSGLDALLDDVLHLYATPYVDPWRPSASFFNGVRTGFEAIRTPDDSLLAVLSREDYQVQRRKHGAALDAVLEVTLHALCDGHPDLAVSLIAPPDCIRTLSAGIRRRVCVSGPLPVDAFRARVQSATRVVYWNVVSASLLYAYYQRRWIGYLDIGHQAELSDRFAQHIIQHVYGGRDPQVTPPGQLESGLAVSRFDWMRGYAGSDPADIVERFAEGG